MPIKLTGHCAVKLIKASRKFTARKKTYMGTLLYVMNIQHSTSATRRQQLHDKVVEIAAKALSGWLQEAQDTGARTFWYFRCIGQLTFSSIDPRKCSPRDALRSCLSMFHRGLRTCTASYPKEAGRMRSPPEPEKHSDQQAREFESQAKGEATNGDICRPERGGEKRVLDAVHAPNARVKNFIEQRDPSHCKARSRL